MTPEFDFIAEYLRFNSGNECPRNFHIWSGLVCLAAAVHKRVYTLLGEDSYVTLYPNLYIALIGDQGSRKSSAKDYALDLFTEAFPDYPQLSDIQSAEDIIKYMNQDQNKFLIPSKTPGETMTVRPIIGFINELNNFLAIDIVKMVDFLTNIYSKKRYKSSTIKRGLEDLENPCMNMLACAPTDWIMEKMKGSIVSGGLSRRLVQVYEPDLGPPIARPKRPEGYAKMWERLKGHLLYASQLSGEFKWEPDMAAFYDKWYIDIRKSMSQEKLMAGFQSSLHDQVLKVSMLLTLSRYPCNFTITLDTFKLAIAMLDAIMPNMAKLFANSGRNQLAIPMQRALEMLEQQGGWIPEKTYRRMLSKDLAPMEIAQVLRFLEHDTGQLVIKDLLFKDPGTGEGIVRRMVMTAAKAAEIEKRFKNEQTTANGAGVSPQVPSVSTGQAGDAVAGGKAFKGEPSK